MNDAKYDQLMIEFGRIESLIDLRLKNLKILGYVAKAHIVLAIGMCITTIVMSIKGASLRFWILFFCIQLTFVVSEIVAFKFIQNNQPKKDDDLESGKTRPMVEPGL